MEKLQPKKIDLLEINSGNRYENGDGISAEAINAPIEASAYVQSLATNAPNISELSGTENPFVGIEEVGNGARFVFKHLQGEKGEKGDKGDIDAVEIEDILIGG